VLVRPEFVSRAVVVLAKSDPFGERMSGSTNGVPAFLHRLTGRSGIGVL